MLGRLFRLAIALLLGIGLTLFLFYIDDGKYSLSDVWQWGNAPTLILYGLMFSGLFYGIAHLLFQAKQKRALESDS